MPTANFSSVRVFLFDLDGTLIDSKLDLVNSVNFMLLEMQREVLPLATVASYIGHGAPRLVADALGPEASEADRKSGLEIFLAHYAEHSLDATRAYPGVVEGLQSLQDRPMAVLTNKPAKMSVEILEALGLLKYFRAVYGGDTFEKKKPDPAGALAILKNLGADPRESAMVGDSDVDIKTARNAGMFAIGVNYGFGQHDRQAQPADLYVDSLREIAALTLQ
ncbi:MAG TPA: HAD-IA family hydrolase [Candidatus Sulfotelmatobacter sp.]|jgi:phosphoglycolate phosphatase|nr:HAD-IA family hydrolase [Candidatus Sulfotelmatobacter sp.]